MNKLSHTVIYNNLRIILIIFIFFVILKLNLVNLSQTSNNRFLKLNNGLQIPAIGLGTWKTSGRQARRAVSDAISVGYRHIDTAFIYDNEIGVGLGIKQLISQNKINRNDIFITGKVWNTFHGRSNAVKGLRLSLTRLGSDYLDLALIHWPTGYPSVDGIVQTWKGMEDAVRQNFTKSIGVSNFNINQLSRILNKSEIKPVVNQVEVHPYLNNQQLIDYCNENNITVVAYSPLRQTDRELMNESVLKQIAKKHHKSVAQVILRWNIQRGVVVIPKTTHKNRMIENLDVFDFDISVDDMNSINKLNKNKRLVIMSETYNHPEYPFKP